MTDTNVFQFSQPGTFADPLTEVLRNGARALLAQAVEAEVAALLGCHADKLTANGHQRVVRHGHLPEREIMTGVGPVAVRCPRVRDRVEQGCERIRFSSAILPPYARLAAALGNGGGSVTTHRIAERAGQRIAARAFARPRSQTWLGPSWPRTAPFAPNSRAAASRA